MKTKTVLSVDDNEDDQLLLQMAWKKIKMPHVLEVACDGEKAIELLTEIKKKAEETSMPDFILLDLKMPRKNGFEVLDWMNQHLGEERPPVAVFSSSQNEADINRAYELGVTWYLAKPVDFAELQELLQHIGRWIESPAGNDLTQSDHYRS